MSARRVGQIIRLKPEKYEEYKQLHAAAWPEVLATIHKANIRNFSIYHWDGYLFGFYEYVGDNYEADMASIAADPKPASGGRSPTPASSPSKAIPPAVSRAIGGRRWKNFFTRINP